MFDNNKTFINIVTEEQLHNIKISQGLYQLISYEPTQEDPTTPKEQPKTYTYYYRLRPPMPGCQPKAGLIETNSNEIIHNNKQYWGTATYNRELTQSEKYEYDLDN